MAIPRREDVYGDYILHGASEIAEYLYGDAGPKFRRRVYHLVDKGDLPVMRLGGTVCARVSSLREMLKACEAKASIGLAQPSEVAAQ